MVGLRFQRITDHLIAAGAKQIKGKGTQKYKWISSKIIWKTAHFDANCMKIGFLVFKILQFCFQNDCQWRPPF